MLPVSACLTFPKVAVKLWQILLESTGLLGEGCQNCGASSALECLKKQGALFQPVPDAEEEPSSPQSRGGGNLALPEGPP